MAKKPKVLLVDNDVDFIELNKAILENNGFEVAIAYAGREVMDKIKFEQPDVIVLDLIMEKHDAGFTVAKSIKVDPLYKNIPILMLSAVLEKTGMDFSQELDGYWMKTDDFANKPVVPEELIKKINRLIATRSKVE